MPGEGGFIELNCSFAATERKTENDCQSCTAPISSQYNDISDAFSASDLNIAYGWYLYIASQHTALTMQDHIVLKMEIPD